MRRIADRIEYSPTAIYFHFRDKDALLAELCDCDFRAFSQNFAAIARIPDPVERLRAAGRAYVDFGLKNPSHYRLMFMTPKTAQSQTIEKGNPEEDAYAFLKVILSDIQTQGRLREELGNVDVAAQVVWAAIHGIVALEIAKCHDAWVEWQPIEERTERMIELIERGVVR